MGPLGCCCSQLDVAFVPDIFGRKTTSNFRRKNIHHGYQRRYGQVDILDAFVLASRIEHRTLEEKWDINGDGQVNQADVEEISAFVVKLGPEGKS